MSHFLRKLWAQKPKQWGSAAMVRRTIAENAEKIYGIDPACIKAAYPYWEGAGAVAHNYAPGLWYKGTIQAGRLINKGFESLVSLDCIEALKGSVISAKEGTVFTKIIPLESGKPSFRYHWATDTYQQFSLYPYSTGLFFYVIGTGTNHTDLNYLYSETNPYTLCASYSGSGGRDRRIDINGTIKSYILALFDTNPAVTDMVYVGGRSNSSDRYVNGVVQTWNYFDRNLTDSQKILLSEVPFGLFNKVPEIYYSIPTDGNILLSGIIDAIADTQGSTSVERVFTGAVNSIADAQGSVSVKRTFDGLIDSIADIEGSTTVKRTFSGITDSIADIEGSTAVSRTFTGSVDTIADIEGSTTVKRTFTVSVNAIADIQGQMSVIEQDRIYLSGIIDSIANAEASLTVKRVMSGIVDAIADIQGIMTVLEQDRIYLSGTIDSTADAQGRFDVTRNLSGVISAEADVQGEISVKIELSGSVDAIADIQGEMYIRVLGVIIDPTIVSITQTHVLESLTPTPVLESLTINRIIESL